LWDLIVELRAHPETLNSMRKNAKSLYRARAAQDMADGLLHTQGAVRGEWVT
jgi:UDP-N-acetylglucosamine:LPS N-acetylglucosamine transferase